MSDTDKFTILIADDHPLVRKGIVTMLSEESDFQVVGEAKDSETTQSLYTQLKPNVLLLDLNMPGSSWLETLTVVKEVSPHTRVLVLTASADINTVRQTVSAGAVGYIVKEEGLLVVMEALRTVLAGGKWFSAMVLKRLLDEPTSVSIMHELNRMTSLTAREIALIRHMAQGKSDLEIAEVLFIAERTIRHTLATIYQKTGTQNRVQLAVYGAQMGLLDEESPISIKE